MPSFPSRSLERRRNGMEAMDAKRGHSLLLGALPVRRPRASRRNRHASTGPRRLLAHPCVPGKPPRCPTCPARGCSRGAGSAGARREPRGAEGLVCTAARPGLPGWVSAALPPFPGSWRLWLHGTAAMLQRLQAEDKCGHRLSHLIVFQSPCSMPMTLSSNSTFQCLVPRSLACPCRSPLFSPGPQISYFPLAHFSSTYFPSDMSLLPVLEQELCSAFGPLYLPCVLSRPSDVNSPLAFPDTGIA